jgi:fructan beta-fructosidase
MPKIYFSTTGGSIRSSESTDKVVEIGLKDGQIFMDARNTWYQDFAITRQEIACSSSEVDFEIYIDRGSIELFADGGKAAITNLVFVETALTSITPTGELRNLTVTNFS